MERIIGIDVGAESIKIAELTSGPGGLRLVNGEVLAHGKAPGPRLLERLRPRDWSSVASAAVTGRLARGVALPRIPSKQALAEGFRLVHGRDPATLVQIGSRGFSVLELRGAGEPVLRESSRCAQGTGNFLRQLVERFGLSVEQAAAEAGGVAEGAPLSGRCPVILKTDLTHLANKGERRERLLAGLFDAIAESAEALVKPGRTPSRVFVLGGVARAQRVREHFRRFCSQRGLALVEIDPDQALLLDAIGCAVHAARLRSAPPPLDRLVVAPDEVRVEILPALRGALGRVHRMPKPPDPEVVPGRELVLGFDIGSTGSKVVALDVARGQPLWEAYGRTQGDPVGAAQRLMRAFLAGPAGSGTVRALGATGSGREIVGSLFATCYGREAVFVLNEIAAHACGALHHDRRVDTIFEIGGQDAKYIRLDHGRVVDAAMNEACSAGTGSFIEEQGRRFAGVADVARLGQIAAAADGSAALGQHCSIFVAEVIDEAVAAHVPRDRVIAGLYESVIANYLNRVKGPRSVGSVVFCQGMPFASDALAAAVARQTGAEVIVPPSPGTVGALGIALLAAEAAHPSSRPALDASVFLDARVEAKDAFVCRSSRGCGGSGNRCRIDRLTTRVSGERQKFTWGGGCALHDQGTRTRKLPDGTPDPFRGRRELAAGLAARLAGHNPGARSVGLVDAFQLKGLLPFFATFVDALGLRVRITGAGGRAALKRGAEGANVAFCAPMQQLHGAVAALLEGDDDHVLVPMLRELPRVGGERASALCPIVQGAPEVLRWDLAGAGGGRILAPVFDVGAATLDAPQLVASCQGLAAQLGVRGRRVREALAAARRAQLEFDAALQALGREALERCRRDGLLPVVVLGRGYTLHDDILNSNLPAILREQGAVAIPVDAYPVDPEAPMFPNTFWGHSQRILRAAWQIRRTPGTYAVFASNYSCGPDSFTLHLFQELMQGKPFAVIETDGHAGDAGTKTRIEAFLHCVREDLASPGARAARPARSADRLTVRERSALEVIRGGETILLPAMGPGSEVIAAALRGYGARAEALPDPGPSALAAGRRHTSGKECLPMILTLGSALERLDRGRGTGERLALLMPTADGPCRFGAYKELHQLVFDRLGLSDRVSIWSPPFGDYFRGIPAGFGALILAGIWAADLLRDMADDVRAREAHPGAADALHRRYMKELAALMAREAAGDLAPRHAIAEAVTGQVFGVPALLRRAGEAFAGAGRDAPAPLVLVVGEIYVRNVPFANGFVVERLAARGIRSRTAGAGEFVAYSDWMASRTRRRSLADRLQGWVRSRIAHACHAAAAGPMAWGGAPEMGETVGAAGRYVRADLACETVLTVGAALHAWRRGEVDAVVSTGPLECMPNKLAESQFAHVSDEEGLLSLTLSLAGDPVDPAALDAFAFEVHARAGARAGRRPGAMVPRNDRPPVLGVPWTGEVAG